MRAALSVTSVKPQTLAPTLSVSCSCGVERNRSKKSCRKHVACASQKQNQSHGSSQEEEEPVIGHPLEGFRSTAKLRVCDRAALLL